MISTSQFKNGITIKIDGELYAILEFQHVKPGKGGAFVRTKLKSISDGAIIDKTFRASQTVEEAFIEEKKVNFIYRADEDCHFMDQTSYEDIVVRDEMIARAKGYLKENTEVTMAFHDGKIVGVILPNFVELAVSYTEPGFRGNTVHGGSKPAKLETGLTIQVPLFINQGDIIKVDTRTGEYVGRVQ